MLLNKKKYGIIHDILYDIIYLLTAIGLPPGGSSIVHVYTKNTQNDTKQTIHRTTQKFWKCAGRAPSLRVGKERMC
jgi:hypothetical protein